MRQRSVFNRKPDKAPQDWFKITNKADSDTTEIEIMDEIGGWWGTTARDFVNQLKKIDTPKIRLHLNSPGGEVFDGVAIYNALRGHDAEVTVIVESLAASAASFIAQAGDKIIMNRGSTMMIHDGLAFCIGNEADMLKTASVLDTVSNNIADIYAARAGGSQEEWRAFMREEVWYTAQEAVDAGLADEVASETAPADAVAASNRWDLSIFAHQGRMDAPSPTEIRRKISNRAKEAPVTTKSTPRNTDAPESTPTPAPAQEPNQPDTPSDPLPEVTEPPTPAEGEQEVEEGTETPPTPPAPTNMASGLTFVINGANVSDLRLVQAHISALEGFRKDTLEANRKEFVAGLARDNKINAADMSKFETFALGLTGDQFEAWKDTFGNAVTLPILGRHTEGTTNHTGDESSREAAVIDKIDTLKAIVQQHRLSGMPKDKIENTNSYKELKQLLPGYEL